MRYVSKPIEIEAVQFLGPFHNLAELKAFIGNNPEGYSNFCRKGSNAEVYDYLHETWITVMPGQYVIRGTKGEYYPCDEEVFKQKYEPVP